MKSFKSRDNKPGQPGQPEPPGEEAEAKAPDQISTGRISTGTQFESFMSIDSIQHALQDRKLYVVSERTRISYPTLKRLREGLPCNYTVNTLRKITEYLRG